MFDKKFTIFIVVLTVAILGVGIMLTSKSSSSEVTNSEVLEITSDAKPKANETYHDWGTIKLNGGKVEKTFKIENDGEAVLQLSNVTTSCMCTTAVLTMGDEVSPEFGMHGKSDYVMSVPAGGVAELKIVFDPAFHGPSGVGAIRRNIKISTNSQDTPELNFTLSAMVEK